MLLGYIVNELKFKEETRTKVIFLFVVIANTIALVCGILLIYSFGVGDYLLYNIIAIPCSAIFLFTLAKVELKPLNIVIYVSNLSYSFFLAQLFIWNIMRAITEYVKLSDNIIRILSSFIICLILAIVLYEGIEKPIKVAIKKGIKHEAKIS